MSDRTKQVQFRMPEETQKELKKALIDDNSSFADFFNEAATAYLNNPKLYKQKNSLSFKSKKDKKDTEEKQNGRS